MCKISKTPTVVMLADPIGLMPPRWTDGESHERWWDGSVRDFLFPGESTERRVGGVNLHVL